MARREQNPVSFVGPAYNGRSSNINDQMCVNWYIEIDPSNDASPMSLIPTPGLTEFVDLGTSQGIRGLWGSSDYLYAVSNNIFFQISPNGVATNEGNLDTSSGPVSFAENPTQIMATDNPNGYIFTPSTSTFAKITSSGFLGAAGVTFSDRYFIVPVPDAQQFQISAINDGLTWSALDFASANTKPDNLVNLIADHGRLWLLGSENTEIWRFTGASAFPFGAISGAVLEAGIDARYSLSKSDNAVFWLGRNKYGKDVVFHSINHNVKIISNRAVEWQISQYDTTSDAIGFCYRQEGHTFYELIFPSADKTWVFDASIPNPEHAWHERSSRLSVGSSLVNGRHRISAHAFFNGQHYVGDFENGKIYILDPDVYADDGQEILRRRRSPTLIDSQNRIFYDELQLYFQPGVGLNSGQGSDPVCTLLWSDDSGNTFPNSRQGKIGKLGEYKQRTRFNLLGSGRLREWEVQVSDPVNAILIDSYLRYRVGSS